MDAVDTTKRAILLFFLGLPMVMIGLVFFLSISLLNTGLIILSLGQVILVPVVTLVLHIVTQFFPGSKVPNSDVGMLVPSMEYLHESKYVNVLPSYWGAHVVFFCSYVFSNALSTYKADSVTASTNAYDWKVHNRMARSTMIMGISVITLLVLLFLRKALTHSETFPGILLALVVFGPLAYFWYQLAVKNGARNSDILGIVQQMVRVQSDKDAAMCVPTKAATAST